ncbi:hypothetical protein [Actinacidiphila oryziradicis]|uniref:Uncharacterized protein n=1 Tax=Actinacidiphila oryziradicis TaxID=2571141 RepID=A0A4U0T0H0_9ACTN|nr:hypothetical protein [Actinacidiphila oryziradicis]TKA06255.1 hypothetical protein FCI23_32540 [Actinacidiphila oryziradicis]
MAAASTAAAEVSPTKAPVVPKIVLLVRTFRSILLPLKAVLLNLVSVSATTRFAGGRAEAAEAAGGLEVAKGARLQHGQRDLDRTDLAVAQVEQATARLDGLAYRTALQPDADQVGVRHVLRGEQQPAAGLPRPWDVRGPSRAVTRV